ncbi:MAG: hypothetical protein ABI438_07980, partial [Dermatophilaceae bacterium]
MPVERPSPRLIGAAAAVSASMLLLSACTAPASGDASATTAASSPAVTPSAPAAVSATSAPKSGPVNVYAGAGAGMLSETAKAAKSLVYVPNTIANTVQVIDPKTFKVIGTYPTGREPQHVVPSWDLKTLWVNDDLGNDMVPIDPRTGRPGKRV